MKNGNKGIGVLVKNIEEAVFPSNIYCICCGSLIDGSRAYSLCDRCMEKLHWINGRTCDRCGKALPETYNGKRCYDCMLHPHSFRKGYSCLTYGLYERKILLDYKYNGKGYLFRKLGDILYDRISCESIRPDVIVPVPIHKKREKNRGYNQATLMARRLSRLWGIPVDDRSLVREKETPPLRSLDPAERELALAEAFRVRRQGKRKLQGKTILLIDDIYTTGATADACSRTLLAAGASAVDLLSLASGGNRKPQTL